MRRLTIRASTTIAVGLVAGGTLVLAAVLLQSVLRAQLTASGDDLNRGRVEDLLALAAHDQLPRTLHNVDDDGVAQVVDGSGAVLAASANVAGRPPITTEPEDDAASGELSVLTVTGPDDAETERYRLWTASGRSADGTPVRAYVGSSLESVDEASSRLRSALLVGVPLVLAVLVLATWWGVGRALRRLDRAREAVEGIGDEELDARLPVGPVDDEVGRLTATLNGLLARLQESRDRQRAFVADVSHDLQSPLAAQRATLEVALRDPARVDTRLLAGELLRDVADLEALVADLLFLVIEEEGRSPVERRPVDLDDVVLEEVTRVRRTAEVQIDAAEVSAAPCEGEASELRRMVRNLLENAVEHAATRVSLRAVVDGGRVVLDVVDDGPGIPAQLGETVFERFVRGDQARRRTRPGTGTGLGLAIARTVARRHGGDVVLVEDQAGAHLCAWLPAVGVPAPDAGSLVR